jgi:hypothetical protein
MAGGTIQRPRFENPKLLANEQASLIPELTVIGLIQTARDSPSQQSFCHAVVMIRL